MDGRVLLFLMAVTILTSVGFGLSPALQASRRGRRRGAEGRWPRNSAGRRAIYTRHAFIALQVAAAFILLAGAGLLIRSFQRVMDVDTGYDTEGIVAAYLPLPMERDPECACADAIHPATARRSARRPRRDARRRSPRDSAARLGRRHAVPLPEKPDEHRRHGIQDRHARVFSGARSARSSPAACSTIAITRARCLSSSSTNRSCAATIPNRTPIGKRILVEQILPITPRPGTADRVGDRRRCRRRERQRPRKRQRRRRLRQVRAESRRRAWARRQRGR